MKVMIFPENFETKLNKKIQIFFKKYKRRIFFYVLLVILVYLFSNLPYFNLIIPSSINPYVSILSIFIIFPFSGRNLLKISVIAFVIIMILSVMQKDSIATLLGSIVYFILLISAVRLTKEFITEN